MKTLEKPKKILWEEESIILNSILDEQSIVLQIEKYMQDEAFYGEPDYSYY